MKGKELLEAAIYVDRGYIADLFYVAKELERSKAEQVWARNDRLKVVRRRLIFASYCTPVSLPFARWRTSSPDLPSNSFEPKPLRRSA